MAPSADVYNEFVGFLFLLLAVTSAIRLARKFYDGRCEIPKKNRSTWTLFVLVVLYSIARGATCLLAGLHKMEYSGYENHYWFTIPATLLLLLQTAFVSKWVAHVADLTLALRSNRFRIGKVSIGLSFTLCVLVDLVTIAAAIDTSQSAKASRLSPSTWNGVINITCGFAYTLNGLIFAVMGLVLCRIWAPGSEDGVSASRRTLAIAICYGSVCAFRGAALLTYAFGSPTPGVNTATDSPFAEPTVLLIEWLGTCVTLYLLTMKPTSSQGQNRSRSGTYGTEVLQTGSDEDDERGAPSESAHISDVSTAAAAAAGLGGGASGGFSATEFDVSDERSGLIAAGGKGQSRVAMSGSSTPNAATTPRASPVATVDSGLGKIGAGVAADRPIPPPARRLRGHSSGAFGAGGGTSVVHVSYGRAGADRGSAQLTASVLQPHQQHQQQPLN